MGISLAASHTAICPRPICQPFNPRTLSSRRSQETCRKECHKISSASCLHQWLLRNRSRWFWCCCWSPGGCSLALCLGVLHSSCGNSTIPPRSAWINAWLLLLLVCARGKSSGNYADWPSPHTPSQQWFTVIKEIKRVLIEKFIKMLAFSKTISFERWMKVHWICLQRRRAFWWWRGVPFFLRSQFLFWHFLTYGDQATQTSDKS